MERERLINIPNGITLGRMVLTGGFMVVHFVHPQNRLLAAALFLLAGVTDFLDGMLARELGQMTWLGKLLDPLADKFLALAALICLVDLKALPVWLMGWVIFKEAYLMLGSMALLRRGIVVSSDFIGKLSTALFIPAVALIYPWHGERALAAVGKVMMYAALVISASAAVHYSWVAVKKSHGLKTN